MLEIIKKFSLFILAASLLAGCASNSTFQYVNPDYSKEKTYSASVLLLTFSDDIISVKNKAKLLDGYSKKHHMFSYQEKKYFHDYFATSFADYSTVKVKGIDPKFKPENIEFEYKELKLQGSDSGFKMFTPKKGKIEYKGSVPNFVIFFEDMYFDKEVAPEGGGLGRGSSSAISIESSLKYLIWDNNKETVVGYGRLEKDFRLMQMPNKTKYIEIFEEYIRQIIISSPFKNKRVLS